MAQEVRQAAHGGLALNGTLHNLRCCLVCRADNAAQVAQLALRHVGATEAAAKPDPAAAAAAATAADSPADAAKAALPKPPVGLPTLPVELEAAEAVAVDVVEQPAGLRVAQLAASVPTAQLALQSDLGHQQPLMVTLGVEAAASGMAASVQPQQEPPSGSMQYGRSSLAAASRRSSRSGTGSSIGGNGPMSCMHRDEVQEGLSEHSSEGVHSRTHGGDYASSCSSKPAAGSMASRSGCHSGARGAVGLQIDSLPVFAPMSHPLASAGTLWGTSSNPQALGGTAAAAGQERLQSSAVASASRRMAPRPLPSFCQPEPETIGPQLGTRLPAVTTRTAGEAAAPASPAAAAVVQTASSGDRSSCTGQGLSASSQLAAEPSPQLAADSTTRLQEQLDR